MTGRKKELPPDQTWLAFEQRHQGNPFLAEDPLYALTEDVINVIKDQVPDFFSEPQEQFERDLARMTGVGFFLHRPLGPPPSLLYNPGLTIGEFIQYSSLPQPRSDEVTAHLLSEVKQEWFKDEYAKEAMRTIRRFIVALWSRSGREDKDIQAALQQERKEERLIIRRAEAYAGWLILNEQFRQELSELQTAWGTAIANRGGFPVLVPTQISPDQLPTLKPRRDSCAKACLAFYRRWCLDRMLTWELPAPLDARLHYGASGNPVMTDDAGVTLLLPWYLLRGEQLDVQAVIQRIRFESAPGHLSGWVRKQSGRTGDQTGEISYQRLYWLYRCYELVLFRRYRKACEKTVEKLDRALGAVMQREEDWVKRLRQRLTRELHSQ